MLSSSDHLTNTVEGYELEVWPKAASAANIGNHCEAVYVKLCVLRSLHVCSQVAQLSL